MAKYLTHNGFGQAAETLTVQTSAGAASADKIPSLTAEGVLDPTLLNAATTGAGKVLLLDGSGRVSQAVMPVGIGQDAGSIQASENLAAGDPVNVHSVGGAARVRKADASSGKEAHGQTATVLFEGTNTAATGLTPGARVYLGAAAGAVVSTTPPTGNGVLAQLIGFATSATSYNFQSNAPIVQAA
jgi:hypothetical protein